mmetsp:Transcript_95052/g.252457  ORF Transcript_95052/g.252457 Transcript_95052/m.252457 type:complete len:275 (-) Transcript_95052:82-906(-)
MLADPWQVCSPGRVHDEGGLLEASMYAVDAGVQDTVVHCQTASKDPLDVVLLQQICQRLAPVAREDVRGRVQILVAVGALELDSPCPHCKGTATVQAARGVWAVGDPLEGVFVVRVLEGTKRVDVLMETLEDNLRVPPQRSQLCDALANRLVEVRANMTLDAVRREGTAMRDEGAVVHRMIVPGRNNRGTSSCKVLHELHDEPGDVTALRHAKSAAHGIVIIDGQKVILHVYNDEGILGAYADSVSAEEVMPPSRVRQLQVFREERGVIAGHVP